MCSSLIVYCTWIYLACQTFPIKSKYWDMNLRSSAHEENNPGKSCNLFLSKAANRIIPFLLKVALRITALHLVYPDSNPDTAISPFFNFWFRFHFPHRPRLDSRHCPPQSLCLICGSEISLATCFMLVLALFNPVWLHKHWLDLILSQSDCVNILS